MRSVQPPDRLGDPTSSLSNDHGGRHLSHHHLVSRFRMCGAIFHSHPPAVSLHVVAPKHGLRMVEEAEGDLIAMCKELI